MRSVLMAGVAMAGLLAASPASALVPVTDAASLIQQVKSYGQQLMDYARQGQQLAQAAQTVEIEMQQLEGFIHSPNLGGAMGLMNQAGIGNSLPFSPYAVQGLLSGHGGISGALGSLSTFANGSFSSNSVYSPHDGSFASEEMNARANGTAGAQGIGMSLMQQLQNHIPVMQALRNRLQTADTPKDVQDAQAALATEQLWAANTSSQLQAANLIYVAQKDADGQRQDQHLRQSIDAALAQDGVTQ